MIPRAEYPRPEAKKDDFLILNGEWDFEFDIEKNGLQKGWHKNPNFSKKIIVPYVFQSKLSGVDEQGFYDTVWYSRTFTIPPEYADKNVLLHFGAVDYECEVFINGNYVGTHFGGLTPFKFNITKELTQNISEPQLLAVRVYDPPFDFNYPRGKQSVDERFSGCDYEKILGIWQSVWLEFVNEIYLDRSDYFIQSDPKTGKVEVGISISGILDPKYVIEAEIFDGNKSLCEPGFSMGDFLGRKGLKEARISLQVDPNEIKLWSPTNTKMYSVQFRIIDGDAEDVVIVDKMDCSFAFRTIEVKGNKILLNGSSIYLKMALYQGYWVDGLWTAPTDEDIKRDLKLTLEMGFNALRLHQIVADPRLLYWADKIGVLLWGEMANGRGSNECKDRVMKEWSEIVRRDRNHPSIITWVPINESWGSGDLQYVENQHWLRSIYYLTKSMDPTRPVVDNDGWEHVKTDICTIHDYSQPEEFVKHYPEDKNAPKDLNEFFSNLQLHRRTYAPGCKHEGTPILISEWGGWGMYAEDPSVKPDRFKYWGYQGVLYKSFDEVLDLYEATIKELLKRKELIIGHCYTEFNDQYQEVNGMLTFDRKPKGNMKRLKAINDLL